MLITKENRIGLLITVSLTAFALLPGCSSKSTLDTTPTPEGSAISVAATPTSVETSETSVVEATVTATGVGVPDQVVQFSVSPAGAGTVTPNIDTTDADGVAATVFTAVQSGAVVVTASVTAEGISDNIGIQVSQAASGGTGNVTISTSQALLIADGHDTAAVTVVVRDELGQPAPDGTLIKLVAGERFVDIDGNGYWSDNIDSLVFDANGNEGWDSFGLIPSTATITGGAGQVVVNYVSGEEAYTVYVKATVDDGGIVGDAELSLQLTPNAALRSIYLASDSLSLSVVSTGGIERSQLRAVGYDVHGNLVPEGLPIVFAILDGPGGGEQLDTLGYGPDTAYTNGQGVATTTISSGTVSGTVRVRAYQGTVLSNAAQVLIAAGPPQYIVIGSQFCNVPYWDHVADSVGVVAVVSDVYLNPVNDSTVVYFSCDEGTMMSHHVRTMLGKGIATSTWFCGNNVGTADGIVEIRAETSGGTVADTGAFINSGIPDSLAVTDWQTRLDASGDHKFYIWVEAFDVNRNYVVSGTKLIVQAIHLDVSDGVFEDGCHSAKDRLQVKSKTLTVDASVTGANDDGVGAIDIFEFWTETGASGSLVCSLMTGPAYSANSNISGATSAIPGEQVRLSAEIADRWGNPLADHTLNMTASGGVVTGGTQETNAYGEATGFMWTAPAGEADYNITVTDTDPRGGGMVLTLTITVKAAT